MIHFGSTSPHIQDYKGKSFSLSHSSTQDPSQKFSNSQLSFEFLLAFFPEFNPEEPQSFPRLLKPLAKEMAQGKEFSQAYLALLPSEQGKLAKKIGIQNLQAILFLSKESDPTLYWHQVLHLGQSLVSEDNLNPALGILGRLSQDKKIVPPAIQKRAESEFNAVVGKGSVTNRLEFLSSRFVKAATDHKMILPMFAGTFAYQVFRTGMLGRLATSNATWFNRGFSARFLSGTMGFVAEVPAFSLSSMGLRRLAGEPIGPVGHELAGATITLGLLKGFGFLGHRGFQKLHGMNAAGEMTRLQGLAKFSQPVMPQASMFLGLLSAHFLEAEIGLRPHVDGATLITDTLSSLFSLGIGMRLGHRGLNSLVPGFESYQQHLAIKAQRYGKAVEGQGDFSLGLEGMALVGANAGGGGLPISLKGEGLSYHVQKMGMKKRPWDQRLSSDRSPKREFASKKKTKGRDTHLGSPKNYLAEWNWIIQEAITQEGGLESLAEKTGLSPDALGKFASGSLPTRWNDMNSLRKYVSQSKSYYGSYSTTNYFWIRAWKQVVADGEISGEKIPPKLTKELKTWAENDLSISQQKRKLNEILRRHYHPNETQGRLNFYGLDLLLAKAKELFGDKYDSRILQGLLLVEGQGFARDLSQPKQEIFIKRLLAKKPGRRTHLAKGLGIDTSAVFVHEQRLVDRFLRYLKIKYLRPSDPREISLFDLDIPKFRKTQFRHLGLNALGDLVTYSAKELKTNLGFSDRAIAIIEEVISQFGLGLKLEKSRFQEFVDEISAQIDVEMPGEGLKILIERETKAFADELRESGDKRKTKIFQARFLSDVTESFQNLGNHLGVARETVRQQAEKLKEELLLRINRNPILLPANPNEISISILGLSKTKMASLREDGVNTLGDLTDITADQILSRKGWGEETLDKVQAILKEFGLSLKGDKVEGRKGPAEGAAGTKLYTTALGPLLLPEIQPKDRTLRKLMSDIPAQDQGTATVAGLLGVGAAFFVPATRLTWNIAKFPFWLGKKLSKPIWSQFIQVSPKSEKSPRHPIIEKINDATGWWETTVGKPRDALTAPGIGLFVFLKDACSVDCYSPGIAAGIFLLYSVGRRLWARRILNKHPELKGKERKEAERKLLGLFPEKP